MKQNHANFNEWFFFSAPFYTSKIINWRLPIIKQLFSPILYSYIFCYFAWVMKIIFLWTKLWRTNEKITKRSLRHYIYVHCIWTKFIWYLCKLISLSKKVTQLKLLVKIYVYSEMHTNTSISIVPYTVWCMHDNMQLNG